MVSCTSFDQDRRRHGDVGARDRLGRGDHVGLDAVVLQREPGARTAEAGDDLVVDQQDVVLVAEFAQPREVAVGGDVYPAGALHGLGDDRRDGVGALVLNRLGDPVDVEVGGVDPAPACELGLDAGGGNGFADARAEVWVVDLHPGHRHRGQGVAVVGLRPADDLGLLGAALHRPVVAGGLEVGLVRLGTRVAEEDGLHVGVAEVDDLGGQLNGGRVAEAHVVAGEGRLRHLVRGGPRQLRTAVTHGNVPEGGEPVDVALAVVPDEVDALPTLDHDRGLMGRGVVERVHPVREVGLDQFLVAGVVHRASLSGSSSRRDILLGRGTGAARKA